MQPAADAVIIERFDLPSLITLALLTGRCLPSLQVTLPTMHPAIEAVIKEWFDLVDEDGSGSISREELAAALKVRC